MEHYMLHVPDQASECSSTDWWMYWLCTCVSGRILRYNTTGQFLGVWANVPGEPRGIRWRHDRLYVSSWDSNRLPSHCILSCISNGVLVGWLHSVIMPLEWISIKVETPWKCRISLGHIWVHLLRTWVMNPAMESSSFVHGNCVFMRLLGIWSCLCRGALSYFVAEWVLTVKWLCSTESGHILQFNGTDGRFERVYTQMHTKYATGFAFGFSRISTDLYVVGAHSGGAVARFDSSTGEVSVNHHPSLSFTICMYVVQGTLQGQLP